MCTPPCFAKKTKLCIAFYPDFPNRTDRRFSSWSNPDSFLERTGRRIQEGDLVQRVYVWGGEKFWYNRVLIDLTQAMHFLPLRDLLKGKEGEKITIKMWGKNLTFTCAQRSSKNNESDFQDFFNYTHQFYAHPENNERFSTLEPFSFPKYKEMVDAAHSLPPSLSSTMEQLYYRAHRKAPLCSNEVLKRQYVRGDHIGGGGDGAVVKVVHKEKREVRALKISCTKFNNPEVVAVVNHVLDEGISPHLTRIYQVMRIPCARNPTILVKPNVDPKKKSDFVDVANANEKPVLRTGTEMELLDGDLEPIYNGLSDWEICAIDLQSQSIMHILSNSFGTKVVDYKIRNILYKRLDKGVTFKGKVMMDYDFWKYTLDGEQFYVPRMPFLIKLGDYDKWHSELVNKGPKERVFAEKSEFLMKARKLFKKPEGENVKVLDMGGS